MTITTTNHTQTEAIPQWWKLVLNGEYLDNRPKRGEIVETRILSIGNRDIYVDLDGKRDGLIHQRDLDEVDETYLAQLSIGDLVPVRIIKSLYSRPVVLVSLKQGLEQHDWIRAKELMNSGDIIEVTASAVNRGGITAELGRICGFIPNSHLVSLPRGLSDDKQREKKSALIGTSLSVAVIEVTPRDNRLILSERLAHKQKRQETLDSLYEGAIRTGMVTNLTHFGAFVDLGGIDGLIHISELGWEYVEHPKEVLNIGDTVEVYVLDIDKERERISLSRRLMIEAPTPEDQSAGK